MQRFDAATFDAKSFNLDDGWTCGELEVIAPLLKNKVEAARRGAEDFLNDSVLPALAAEDATYRNLEREARRLEQKYEAVRARLFLVVPREEPVGDGAVRRRISEAKLLYDRLTLALRDARQYKAAVAGLLSPEEAVHSARHIAMLETRQALAWREYQGALLDLGARPVVDARVVAARELVKAEKNMARLDAQGGRPSEIFEAGAVLRDAVQSWKDTTNAMRIRRQRNAMPLPDASEAQKLIGSEQFRGWLEQGHRFVLREASARRVDLSTHMDVWGKAVQSFAVPDQQESVPETEQLVTSRNAPAHASMDSRSAPRQEPVPSRSASRQSEMSRSWSVVDAEQDPDASRNRSRNARRALLSANALRPPRAPTPRRAPSGALQRLSALSIAAQRTDTEDSDSDFEPQNISTPVPQGGRPPVPSAVRIQARPHEFGNVTLGSLASVLPPSRAERSGRNNAVSTSGAANFFDDAEPAPSRDYDYDVYHAEPLVVAWDPRSNRAVHFAAVREGQSQGGFMDFIDGLGQGRGFRVDRGSRFACVIGRSRPVRGVPPEYYAVVTFPTHAQAQLCIDYITAQAMHFNMTPMGVQGTWRMLTAQWSNNPHYNGKADAEYEAALRRQYPR